LSITSIFDRAQDSDESAIDHGYVRRWLDISSVKTPPSNEFESTANSSEQEILTFRASIESEDRVGDVIRADGWELDNYRSNPVVLWGHRHDLLPVGKSVDVWVDGDALMASIEFAPTDFAQQVKKLFTEGFLRGVSVGFRSLKSSRRPDGKAGTVFERQELLEISSAPVPMHPHALAGGKASGSDDDFEITRLFQELTDVWQLIARQLS
jgi:HK97 family phage prohead protease